MNWFYAFVAIPLLFAAGVLAEKHYWMAHFLVVVGSIFIGLLVSRADEAGRLRRRKGVSDA